MHSHPPAGVLTKLDIMDRGTDAVAVLRNEAVPLALGFVGVVLRSQEDIANRRSMADARGAERAFFESHPEYMEVAPQVCGGGVPQVGELRWCLLCWEVLHASGGRCCCTGAACVWGCTWVQSLVGTVETEGGAGGCAQTRCKPAPHRSRR